MLLLGEKHCRRGETCELLAWDDQAAEGKGLAGQATWWGNRLRGSQKNTSVVILCDVPELIVEDSLFVGVYLIHLTQKLPKCPSSSRSTTEPRGGHRHPAPVSVLVQPAADVSGGSAGRGGARPRLHEGRPGDAGPVLQTWNRYWQMLFSFRRDVFLKFTAKLDRAKPMHVEGVVFSVGGKWDWKIWPGGHDNFKAKRQSVSTQLWFNHDGVSGKEMRSEHQEPE